MKTGKKKPSIDKDMRKIRKKNTVKIRDEDGFNEIRMKQRLPQIGDE